MTRRVHEAVKALLWEMTAVLCGYALAVAVGGLVWLAGRALGIW